MQAITTEYIRATATRGARIKAQCERCSITLAWPYELSGSACHVWAADQLIAKFLQEDAKQYGRRKNSWTHPRVCGVTHDGKMVHVFIDPSDNTIVISFNNSDDRNHVERYIREAKSSDGTVTGLRAGLMCSALKRSV